VRKRKFLSRFDWHPILSPVFIDVGFGLDFWYPTQNRFGIPIEFTNRTIAVTKVEYLRGRGVPSRWIIQNPLVRRGDWLITGIDVELNAERSFYWEIMAHPLVRDAGAMKRLVPSVRRKIRDACKLPNLRLGFYAAGEFIDWVSEPFAPTRQARLDLKEAAIRMEESRLDMYSDLELSAFPVRASA